MGVRGAGRRPRQPQEPGPSGYLRRPEDHHEDAEIVERRAHIDLPALFAEALDG
jgi:hypothetical protein